METEAWAKRGSWLIKRKNPVVCKGLYKPHNGWPIQQKNCKNVNMAMKKITPCLCLGLPVNKPKLAIHADPTKTCFSVMLQWCIRGRIKLSKNSKVVPFLPQEFLYRKSIGVHLDVILSKISGIVKFSWSPLWSPLPVKVAVTKIQQQIIKF